MTTQPSSRSFRAPFTRRCFLRSTAVTGAFLLGAPAFLRAKGLNDKLNIAIIGAGIALLLEQFDKQAGR